MKFKLLALSLLYVLSGSLIQAEPNSSDLAIKPSPQFKNSTNTNKPSSTQNQQQSPIQKQAPAQNKVQWLTSYEDALDKAKNSSKAILLFFTGSDWCTWCTKLEKEVFSTPDFAQEAAAKYIFVKLDFPQNKPLDQKTAQQNAQLKKKYNIRSYPTVILIDHNQKIIGETGYRSGGGKSYANHLKKMVEGYQSYRGQIDELKDESLSFHDLKKLYQKADELNDEKEMNIILKKGLSKDEDNYFLLEAYRARVSEGLMHDEETMKMRAKLLSSDPQNLKQTHYHVAVIDFEGNAQQLELKNISPEIAIAPLKEYLQKFGKEDTENGWRLHMIISQVYLDQNNMIEAMKHARLAQELAPIPAKNNVSKAVDNIQSLLEQASLEQQ